MSWRKEKTTESHKQGFPQFAQRSLLMTEGSKSLEQKANLNSQKGSAFWKQSGETTKTAKQQVKQKGRSESPSVLHHNEEASSPVRWIRLQDYCPPDVGKTFISAKKT